MRKRDPEKSKNYRHQQYRPAWEKESWAHGWLSRSSLDYTKAYCNLCHKEFVPGKSELQSHSKSAVHVRHFKAMHRVCKPECTEDPIVCNKGKDGLFVLASNPHSNQEPYKLKPGISSGFPNHTHANVVSQEMELAGATDSTVNDILHEAQSVSEIGFTEDLWENSLQVETAMAVEGLASLSRNESQVHSNQSSSAQPTQIVILTPSSTAPNSLTVKSNAVAKSEAILYNKKPITSTRLVNNSATRPPQAASFMHNYSSTSTPSQTQPDTAASSEQQTSGTSGKCNKGCHCKVQNSYWTEYLTEKIKLKRLEQQRVHEELKTQKLIQQYHRMKVRKLQAEGVQKSVD